MILQETTGKQLRTGVLMGKQYGQFAF